MADDYPFKVVRFCGTYDEPIALAINLVVARGAFEAAVRPYPSDEIHPPQGARVV
jgi:hypothetical protein